MWLLAVGVGMVFGKTIIHGILLSRFLRLKMFRADQVNHTIKVSELRFIINCRLFASKILSRI